MRRPAGHALFLSIGDLLQKQTRVVQAVSKLLDKPAEMFAYIRPLLSEMDKSLAKAHPSYTEKDRHVFYLVGDKREIGCYTSKIIDPNDSILEHLYDKEKVATLPASIRENMEELLHAAPEVFTEGFSVEAPLEKAWYDILQQYFPHNANKHRNPSQLLKDAFLCCTTCGSKKGAQKFCSGCSTARYCSRECQLRDWRKHHKRVCWAIRYCRAAGKTSYAVKDKD